MACDGKTSMIAETAAFRPVGDWLVDKHLADHARGRAGDLVDVKRSKPGAMLPPHPTRAAPTTTLAQRMRERMEKGG